MPFQRQVRHPLQRHSFESNGFSKTNEAALEAAGTPKRYCSGLADTTKRQDIGHATENIAQLYHTTAKSPDGKHIETQGRQQASPCSTFIVVLAYLRLALQVDLQTD